MDSFGTTNIFTSIHAVMCTGKNRYTIFLQLIKTSYILANFVNNWANVPTMQMIMNIVHTPIHTLTKNQDN